jgi:hypothetical protein
MTMRLFGGTPFDLNFGILWIGRRVSDSDQSLHDETGTQIKAKHLS